MPPQVAKLYIKDSTSPHNHRLIAFLKEYLTLINRAGLRIDCSIANPADAKQFENDGVHGFPALILNGIVSIGNQEIEQFLFKIIKRPQPTFDNDDDVANWLITTATTHSNGSRYIPPNAKGASAQSRQKTEEPMVNDADTSDEDDDESKKLQEQIQKAMRDRMSRDPKFGKGIQSENRISRPTNPVSESRQIPQKTQQIQRPNNIGGGGGMPIGQKIKSGHHPSDDELLSNLLANQE